MNSQEQQPLFNQYAESYDETLRKSLSVTGENAEHFLNRCMTHILRRLDGWNIKIQSILDFGCGIGNAIPALQKNWLNVKILGVDLSSESINVAKRRFEYKNVEFLALSEFRPENQFDIVYVNGVFHHVLPSDRLDVIEITRNSLKPGGIFILCDNNPWNPGTQYLTWKTEFDKEANLLSAGMARRLLRKKFFEILRTDHLFIFPRCLKWFQPLEHFVVSLPLGGQYVIMLSSPNVPVEIFLR